MTHKEIEEGNKLIADFMGLVACSHPYNGAYMGSNPELIDVIEKEMQDESWYFYPKFDDSWDWLMPIVERIDKLTMPENIHLSIQGLNIFSSLEDVYKAVIEFIKWYNNKEK